MTTLDQLTEEIVARYALPQALTRGRALYKAGEVQERQVLDNGSLDALVWDGNRDYALQVKLEGNSLMVGCECKESRRAVCAHTVALLLAWVHQPASFERHGAPRSPAAVGLRSGTVVVPMDGQGEIAQMLGQLSVAQLRDLAKRHNLTLDGPTSDAFVQPLAQVLALRDTVARVWRTLSRPAQKLLGALPLLRVKNLVNPQQAKSAFQMLDSKAAANFDGLLRELSSAGLVFAGQQQFISVPALLGFNLPPDTDFAPSPDDYARLKPQIAAPAPLDFVSLATRLALVIKANPDRYTVRPRPDVHPIEQQVYTLTGWPHYPAELEALKYDQQGVNQIYAKSFGVPPAPSPVIDEARADLADAVGVTPDRLDFALRLLIASGIIMAAPGQPLVIVEQPCNDWLAQPLLDRALTLFAAYANLNTWTELDRLSELHHPAPHVRHTGNVAYGQTYASTLGSLSVARGFLMLMLRRASPNRWIDLEAFVEHARAFHINLNVWPLVQGAYLDLNGRQPNIANAKDWQDVYGSFLETVLTGPLWWQGVVELATRFDRVTAFRLTEFGARLFGQNLDYAPPRSGDARGRSAVTFQPNGDLALNVETASTALLGLLTQVCEARSDPAGQLIYRLSPAGVSRLFESGWDDAKLIGALQKSIGQSLPDSWRKSIEQWWANYGTLHLYADVAVIELADDYALTELLAGTSLAKHLLYRFSPRLIAVRPEGVDELRSDLIRKGYTPKIMGN
ncbi:MAG: helicase-associated domain-containing protein [Chloroflexi bacterium]|nr:helicase-associated domain-containing protein [Chloroflexota bacterium]